jgi:hypothetical protein
MGAVWKLSGLASMLTQTIASHKEDIVAMKQGLDALKLLPVIETRVSQLETVVSKFSSIYPTMKARLDVLESKVVSLREMRSPYRSTTNEADK